MKDSWEAQKQELKARCEKKNLNYEEELKKLEDSKAEKERVAAEKKKANDEKKAAAKKAKEEELQNKINAMTAEEKAHYEQGLAEKKAKKEAYDKKVAEEFQALRDENADIRQKYLAL